MEENEYKVTYITKDGKREEIYVQADNSDDASKYCVNVLDSKRIISVDRMPASLNLF